MKNKWKTFLILLNIILLTIVSGTTISKEERYRKSENYFYLKLSPIDPRSIMQGDYMRLNYEISDRANEKYLKDENKEKKRYILIKLDNERVGQFIDISEKPIGSDDILSIKVLNSNYSNINANSFFFQEGKGKEYEKAKYAKVIIVNNRLRLLNLVDKNKKIIHN